MLTFILFLAAATVFFLVVKNLVSKNTKTSNSTSEVVVETPVKSTETKDVVEHFGVPVGTSSETVESVAEVNEVVKKVKKTATKKATTKKPTKKSK